MWRHTLISEFETHLKKRNRQRLLVSSELEVWLTQTVPTRVNTVSDSCLFTLFEDTLQSMNNAFKFRYVTKSLQTYISLYLLVFAVQPSINCFISSKQINPFTVNVFM